MGNGQFEGKVVSMAMPFPCSERINHRKSRCSPSQPGPFSDQLKRHTPLTQSRRRKNALTSVLTITETAPDPLWHQRPRRGLNQQRHPRHNRQNHHSKANSQQRYKPGPADRTQHNRERQHQGSPAIARLREHEGRHKSDHQAQNNSPPQLAQARLNQSCQRQWPNQCQPGGGDIGVIKQPGQTTFWFATRGHEPNNQSTQDLPGALPAPPKLPQTRQHHWEATCHQPKRRTTACLSRADIGLKAPKRPKERQPVPHAHPGEGSGIGAKASDHHQQRRQ